MRSSVLIYLGRWDTALDANATSIKLDPDEATYLNGRAYIMNTMGRPAEALQLTDRALAMDTTAYNFLDAAINACISYQLLGQAERAIAMCEKGVANGRNWIVRIRLAAAYANHGDTEHSAVVKAEVLRTVPNFTVAQARAADQRSHPEYAKLAEKYYYEGLRKAGFAEQ